MSSLIEGALMNRAAVIPTHPPINTRPYNPWDTLRSARRDLLAGWRADDYRVGVDDFRIFGRQIVTVNCPKAVKQVLVQDNDLYERKSPQMRRALEVLLGDGLFISDGQTWASRRPLVADIVHKGRLAAFAPIMRDAALELVEHWRNSPPNAPVDILYEMALLAAEIIARTVFDVQLGRERARRVVEGFAAYQAAVDSFNVGYLLGFDEGLPIWRGLRLRRAVRQVHSVIDEVTAEYLRNHDNPAATVQRKSGRWPEGKLSADAFRNEAATLFMAGYETTATTLAWAWYLLDCAPSAEQRLHQELSDVCAGEPPSLDKLADLSFCRAVVDETLRLYPPVPLLSRQARSTSELGGVKVDRAALVVVSPWLLHRSADLWSEPMAFRPDRFLSDSVTPYSYIPFAAGPRICPGLNFGIAETMVCMAVLAQHFRFTRAPEDVQARCRLTLRPQGLTMLVEPR